MDEEITITIPAIEITEENLEKVQQFLGNITVDVGDVINLTHTIKVPGLQGIVTRLKLLMAIVEYPGSLAKEIYTTLGEIFDGH